MKTKSIIDFVGNTPLIEVQHIFKKKGVKLLLKLEGNNFDLNYTLKNLYKYKKGLSPEEINFIDNNINDHWKD